MSLQAYNPLQTWLPLAMLISLCVGSLASAAGPAPPTYIGVRMPSESERTAAEALYKGQYAAENIEQAQPLAQLEFMQRVLRDADSHRANPAERFVWKYNAALTGARAGQWRDALQTCDELSSEFNAPFATTRAPIVREIFKHHARQPTTGLSDQLLLRLIYDTLEGCLAEDAMSEGSSLVDLCQTLEAKLNRPGMYAYSTQYRARIAKQEAGYRNSRIADLQNDPLNPDANQAWGEYCAFVKGDFEAALPHFAMCADPKLNGVAQRDLSRPTIAVERQKMAAEYQALIGQSAKPGFNEAMQDRSRYWLAQAAIAELAMQPHRWNNSPLIDPNPQSNLNRTPWAPGASAAKQQRPYGSSLLLTFDQNAVQRDNSASFFAQASGRTVEGNRVVLIDGSPRANHAEGFLSRNGFGRLSNEAWVTQGIPLVLPRKLTANLTGYTFATWVRFDGNESGILLSEPPKINTDAPNDAVHWSFDAKSQLQLRQPYPLSVVPGAKALRPTKLRTSPFTPGSWHFLAVTVLPNQTMRINVDLQTLIAPQRPCIGGKDGITLIGHLVTQLDNLVFFPRALSAGEVDALYHLGLTSTSLVASDTGLEERQPIMLAPLIYHNPNEPLAGTPTTNNNNIPGVDPPNENPNPNPTPNTNPNTGRPPKVASNKTPKPTAEELKSGEQQVNELFAKDLVKAETPEQKAALARKLQSVARTTDDSPAARYMLLQEAAELLTKIDSIEAWEAWDLLGNEFDTNVIEEKSELLDRLQRKAKIPGDYKVLAYRYVGLLNDALQIDDYRVAGLLSNRAELCVKKFGDKVLERMVQQGTKDLKQMKSAYLAVEAAKKKVTESPDDKAAAYDWGRYLCLYRGNFDLGLPFLASGTDQPFATLARQDAANPNTLALQTALADAWWDQAEKAEDDRSRKMLRSRATHWYKQALPAAAGVMAAKLRKRVDDYMAEVSPIPMKEQVDVLSMIDVNTHGTVGRWLRQGTVIAVTSDQQRGSNLKVPISINGSYEMQMRLDWQGRSSSPSSGVYLMLPVGSSMAEIAINREPQLALTAGAESRVKVDMLSLSLDQGKFYEVIASVETDGDQATIKVAMNRRPYLSWSGPISELDTPSERRNDFGGGGFGPRGFGRPERPGKNSDSTIRVVGYYPVDAYAISMMQLKMTSGWAEPLR